MRIDKSKLLLLQSVVISVTTCLLLAGILWRGVPLSHNYDASSLLALAGTIVTAMSFLVGAFFAYVAVDVFRDSKEIERRLTSVVDLEKKLEQLLLKSDIAKQEFAKLAYGYPEAVRHSLNLMRRVATELPSVVELVKKCHSQYANGGDASAVALSIRQVGARLTVLREEAERCEARALIPLASNVDDIIRCVRTLYALGDNYDDIALVQSASKRDVHHKELEIVCAKAIEALTERVIGHDGRPTDE